jgi:hypothetical protein
MAMTLAGRSPLLAVASAEPAVSGVAAVASYLGLVVKKV